MSRFNNTGYNTGMKANLAGGKGFVMNPKEELAGLILTSWAADKFYQSFTQECARLDKLIVECGPDFALKCAVYARRVHGLRSISHVVAAKVSKLQDLKPFFPWRKYYDLVIQRPDDITEILALLDCKITHAMKKAFAGQMESFSEYQLAKYAKFDRAQKVNLNDAVRVLNTKKTDALEKLVYRTLKNTDTWESRGNTKEAWTSLIEEGKLGYLALLRNLRNMEGHSLSDLAARELTKPEAVKKSRIFPFQFLNAYRNVSSPVLKNAIITACDLSMDNIPDVPGKTVILLDTSGSMAQNRMNETGALFACAFPRAEIVLFDTRAKFASVRKGMRGALSMPFSGGGTDFQCAYRFLRDNQVKADRLIVISDMQHWVGGDSSYGTYLEWKDLTGSDPELWSIDLAGYGTTQFPAARARQLFGFSEKIFEVMSDIEESLVDKIEAFKAE